MATSRRIPPNDLKFRVKVFYPARDGKERHGVVLRTWPDGAVPAFLACFAPKNRAFQGSMLLVVAGTSQEPREHHGEKFVRVEKGTRACIALRLQCTTWFKDSMIEVIPVEAVIRIDGQAPPSVGLDLEGLIPAEPAPIKKKPEEPA